MKNLDLPQRCKLLGEIMPNGVSLEILVEILTRIVEEYSSSGSDDSENFAIASQSFTEGFQKR